MPFFILIFLAMAVAAFYLRKRTSPWLFALLAAAIGLGIYMLGILFIESWYDGQLAQDRYVEGKGLAGGFFFVSAFAGLWIGSATSTLVANASGIDTMRIIRVVSALALFLLTFAATIPAGIHFGFVLVY